MRTPTSRCVITCAFDNDGGMQIATRPAAKANRMRMNESPLVDGVSWSLHPAFWPSPTADYPMRGGSDHSETASNAFNRRNFRARAAPLNLRCLFAIRAADISRGMGRSGAIRPAIANTSAAVARNAWPIRDLLMPSSFDTVANIISETCDIPRDTIKPESHAINDLGIDSLDFLDIAFAIDKAFGIKMPLEQWTQEVNDGKATTEQYFQLNNLCTRIDELVAAKGA